MLFDTDSGGLNLPEISNSLRFNASNSYLTKTFTAGDQQKWTFSTWKKRSDLGRLQSILDVSGSGLYDSIYFNASDQIQRYSVDTSGTVNRCIKNTNAVFRDPAAWLHIVIAQDTTQAIAADRFKLWINNQLQLLTTTSEIAQNWNSYINSASTHTIGQTAAGASGYYGGYSAYDCFIGGQVKAPSDFAYADPNGQWRSLPKQNLAALASAGGTNSCFLPFDNGASTTTLGYDASSKGNNWTLTNMVRDGSIDDCWSYDTPTNNFPVLNPLANSTYPLAKGALHTETNVGYNSCPCTINLPLTGKFWFLYHCTNTDGGNRRDEIGIIDNSVSRAIVGMMANSAAYVGFNGAGVIGGTQVATYTGWASGNVVMCAIDCDTGKVWFGLDGTWNGNPAAGTGQCGTLTNNGNLAFCVSNAGDGQPYYTTRGSVSFGQTPLASGAYYASAGGYFRYAPPTGFKALNTKNLPAGSVTTSGSFTGNASANGPFVSLNGTPTAMTIDGNAVTWGVHADKLSNGFKIRTASSPYNDAASNSYTVTTNAGVFKYNNAESN